MLKNQNSDTIVNKTNAAKERLQVRATIMVPVDKNIALTFISIYQDTI